MANDTLRQLIAASKRGYAPDLDGLKPEFKDRLLNLQLNWGRELPIVSGYRDPKRNARAGGAKRSRHIQRDAVDIDVSGLPRAERVKLIKMARKAGFGGVGVYANSIHLDTGPTRAWGPSYKSKSLPKWARDALRGTGGSASSGDAPAPIQSASAYAGQRREPVGKRMLRELFGTGQRDGMTTASNEMSASGAQGASNGDAYETPIGYRDPSQAIEPGQMRHDWETDLSKPIPAPPPRPPSSRTAINPPHAQNTQSANMQSDFGNPLFKMFGRLFS